MARALAELGVDVLRNRLPRQFRSPTATLPRRSRASCARPPWRCSRAACRLTSRPPRALEGAAKPRIHVFLSTSPLHREHKLRMSKQQVIDSIATHVALARRYVDDVEFSPEDGTRTEEDFLHEAVGVAIAAGATTINVPDTLGYTTPEEIAACSSA